MNKLQVNIRYFVSDTSSVSKNVLVQDRVGNPKVNTHPCVSQAYTNKKENTLTNK